MKRTEMLRKRWKNIYQRKCGSNLNCQINYFPENNHTLEKTIDVCWCSKLRVQISSRGKTPNDDIESSSSPMDTSLSFLPYLRPRSKTIRCESIRGSMTARVIAFSLQRTSLSKRTCPCDYIDILVIDRNLIIQPRRDATLFSHNQTETKLNIECRVQICLNR